MRSVLNQLNNLFLASGQYIELYHIIQALLLYILMPIRMTRYVYQEIGPVFIGFYNGLS